MNITVPVSWLREYLKTDLATKTIAKQLSLSGPNVEKIKPYKEDFLFDVEITTNRADIFSVWGLAKEANAILTANGENSNLVSPKGLNLNLDPDVSALLPLVVIIKNKNLCPRFTAIVVDNVKIKPSPAYITNRLKLSGIRPINNIVDISNYIMLELGQPMHTFDFDKIKGRKMILRAAKEGEKITTLDGKTRKLPGGSIVIEDEARLIDLCGIMGGANSQITRRTKRVVIFAQAYNPAAIRRTTQALSFRTEAATRFEKGVDTFGIIHALARAVYLVKKTSGAKIASELIDILNEKPITGEITLKSSKLNQYLGMDFPLKKASEILGLLGFTAEIKNDQIIAKVPCWRSQDVLEDVDLIEEIARIYGYDKLSSKIPSGEIPVNFESELPSVLKLKRMLKLLGLTEVMSYSIISQRLLEVTKVEKDKIVRLENPLTLEWQYMRPTLLISLVDIVAKNQNIKNNLKIFEIAKTYLKNSNDLPRQDLMLSVVFQNANFYSLKGLVENIFELLDRKVAFAKLDTNDPLFEEGGALELKIASKTVGRLGFLKNSIISALGVEEQIVACELNLSTIYEHPAQVKIFKPIPKYPPVIEDISAIFGTGIDLEDILSAVEKAGSPLVKNLKVIDVFADLKIGAGHKSVTVRISYLRLDRQPTQEEVKETREKIIASLEKTFGAKIRR